MMNEHLLAILRHLSINPEQVCHTDHGQRTALQLLEAAVSGALDEIEADGDTNRSTHCDMLLQKAIEGLQEHYACLDDPSLVSTIKAAVAVPDTGNHQLDYENARDQVERIARQHECRYVDDEV